MYCLLSFIFYLLPVPEINGPQNSTFQRSCTNYSQNEPLRTFTPDMSPDMHFGHNRTFRSKCHKLSRKSSNIEACQAALQNFLRMRWASFDFSQYHTKLLHIFAH